MDNKQPAQIMPMLTVASVDACRDFYVDKLGFTHQMAVVGNDGGLDFCTVVKDGAKIMFTRGDGTEAPAPSAQLYMEVRGVEDYHKWISGQGVQATAPEDMWWGDRVFIATDNSGYKLWFYETVADPIPPAGMKIV